MTDIIDRLRVRTFRDVGDFAQQFNEQGNLTKGDALLHEQAADEIERLRAQAKHAEDCAEAYKAEAAHWKNNHETEVRRARALKERTDMPLERVQAYEKWGEDMRDAARYRWLRERGGGSWHLQPESGGPSFKAAGEFFDATVDDAMAAEMPANDQHNRTPEQGVPG